MKISKLFHWLYATLMLLPVFALGSAILVNTFNNQAKDEVNIVYKYETNELNSLDDLVEGNIYTLNLSTWQSGDGVYTSYIQFTGVDEDNGTISTSTIIENGYLYFWFYDDKYIFESNGLSNLNFNTIVNNKIDIVYQLDTFEDYQVHLNDISKCENVPIERVEQKNITNVFYEAVDQIKNNDLFNWSSNTFFADAFVYIGSLFNIPSGSFIYLLLSYWFSISIIWMVFDMAIYVPLLIHRWLDKGVLK